jgi:hypothetical protein
MASPYRPNRYLSASLRGERSIDAAEQQAREQILRENAKAAAQTAAASARIKTNPKDGQSPLITKN